ERRSPAERNRDPARCRQTSGGPSLVLPGIRRVELEVPGAVQVHPVRSLEIRSRVLRERNVLACVLTRRRTRDRRQRDEGCQRRGTCQPQVDPLTCLSHGQEKGWVVGSTPSERCRARFDAGRRSRESTTRHLAATTAMSRHPLAGKPAPRELLINVPRLLSRYYTSPPDPSQPGQRVTFGTSGHRGTSLESSFNEDHILATCQAIAEYRKAEG